MGLGEACDREPRVVDKPPVQVIGGGQIGVLINEAEVGIGFRTGERGGRAGAHRDQEDGEEGD